jgi:quinol monooxygenase YgiN
MTTMIVQHNVTDFDLWKPIFDEHGAVRATHGCSSADVYRGAEDPNAITIVMTYPNLDAAKAFASDPSLKEAMGRGGVTGPPAISFVEPAEARV